MRYALFALLLVAVLTPAAVAVPVDPNAPDQVAALWVDGAIYALRTNGEVWRLTSNLEWERPTPPADLSLPLPVPVSDIADWHVFTLQTKTGVWWRLYSTWELVPALPFGTVPVQQKSLGSVKQGYR